MLDIDQEFIQHGKHSRFENPSRGQRQNLVLKYIYYVTLYNTNIKISQRFIRFSRIILHQNVTSVAMQV